MKDYNVLDLFCGLGGFSQAFEESDMWDVTTVDIEEDFDPDIVANVFNLKPSDFDLDFDVVLASPPCTTMGKMALMHETFKDGVPQTDRAQDHVTLAYHTIGLIKGLSPEFWFMENPQGAMRDVVGEPTGTVTYCQYGLDYMKRTHLWGKHPHMKYKSCREGDDCHISTPRSNDRHPTDSVPGDSSKAAKIPRELSEAILNACESALQGNSAQQTTTERWLQA